MRIWKYGHIRIVGIQNTAQAFSKFRRLCTRSVDLHEPRFVEAHRCSKSRYTLQLKITPAQVACVCIAFTDLAPAPSRADIAQRSKRCESDTDTSICVWGGYGFEYVCVGVYGCMDVGMYGCMCVCVYMCIGGVMCLGVSSGMSLNMCNTMVNVTSICLDGQA